MWELYKKTVWGMQIMIFAVAGGIFVWRHAWDLAAIFLVTMEIGAVLGAAWGSHLQNRIRRGTGQAALR